jgi:F-type H+-transporting ATPase subunit b
MSVISAIQLYVAAAEGSEEHIDRTHHWLWPEGYEILFGGIASVIIFTLLFWKGSPLVKKALAQRTARIQADLDAAEQDDEEAVAEAARIRQAKGDIETERARLLAEADDRAAALLADGRARLDAEVTELEAKADADIVLLGSRTVDEMRAEIARLSALAAERLVEDSLDDATQQRLIEEFIAEVGATTPADHGARV